MTITEALQELKTIDKRINKNIESYVEYIYRAEALRDPLEKDGGSAAFIKERRQAVRDLLNRKVELRTAIAQVNRLNSITVAGVTKTIEEWLVWKREVAPVTERELTAIRAKLHEGASLAIQPLQQRRLLGAAVAAANVGEGKPIPVVTNVNEKAFAEEQEQYEKIVGELDGQLSLKNALINLPK